MQWHTDNKYYDQNKKGSTITKTPGLIFITYISDVNDGEFQYVKVRIFGPLQANIMIILKKKYSQNLVKT